MSDAIRIGVLADQTGPLAPLGGAQANTAKLVVDEMNAAGGLLGRPLELHLHDSASDDELAGKLAAKLVQEDNVDVVLGGIFSSTRQAIKKPVCEGLGRHNRERYARWRFDFRSEKWTRGARHDPGPYEDFQAVTRCLGNRSTANG